MKQEDQLDGWGRESTSFSQLILIKPDSCIFKSWLGDGDGKRYKEDDNYQEFIGGILATASKDSIEFYTKRVTRGGNDSLSPLLTLSKKNKNYLIYSLITSPPHNGIVGMTITKVIEYTQKFFVVERSFIKTVISRNEILIWSKNLKTVITKD